MERTLKEVCDELVVSRRAVQGYEKAGLVTATGKNQRGYLLYDDESQARIKKIKLFQEMGFSLKEIANIIDAPDEILKEVLEKQIKKLENDIEHKSNIIHCVNEIISQL